MKFSCTQENLHRGLFVVSHVASRNVTLPILTNILIRAQKDGIQLSATNLEIGVNCLVRGKVEQPGECAVQSRLFADYVGLLPKKPIDLQTAGDDQATPASLRVKSENHQTTIHCQPATDFPVIPKIEKQGGYALAARDFREALGQTIFAASISETRPEIAGIFFQFTQKNLTIAATDSYRLAEKKINLQSPVTTQPRSFIVPARALQEVQRILSGMKDPADIDEVSVVEVYATDNQIAFCFGGVELVSRLVEGKYPDYQQIIPRQYACSVTAATSELVAAVKSASLFARTGIYDVALKIDPSAKEVSVSSTSVQLGENTTRVAAEVRGPQSSIVLNFRYVLDGLQACGTAQIELGVVDEASPCVVRPSGKAEDYLYLVMPIKQ